MKPDFIIKAENKLLEKYKLCNPKHWKIMKEGFYKERIESYQVQIEFIDPETMQVIDNTKNPVALWIDDNNILKASIYVYDNIRKPLIVKIKDKL